MNIENLVHNFKLPYRSAVKASGCGERLPNTTEIKMPVIWQHSDGEEVALTELYSYDYTASADGITEYIGFKTDSKRSSFIQFQIRDGKVLHDLFKPVYI
jgi:hypothetical protein